MRTSALQNSLHRAVESSSSRADYLLPSQSGGRTSTLDAMLSLTCIASLKEAAERRTEVSYSCDLKWSSKVVVEF